MPWRRSLAAVLCLLILVTYGLPTLAGSPVRVTLDGKELAFDVPPVIVGGRTLVPLRKIFEALGAQVSWDPGTQTVTAVRGAVTIVLTIGQTAARVGDRTVTLDVSAQIVDARTMVPVRFIAESLGEQVDYDAKTRTVILTTSDPPPRLESVTANTALAGSSTWLFAVHDGNPNPVVSVESGGSLYAGRLSLSSPAAPVAWQLVAGPTDTEGKSIADHWHIFAHGYHWLAFSTAGDRTSYLLQLDPNLKRVSSQRVVNNAAVTPQESGPGKPPVGAPVITNDLFLTADGNGVAVGHFLPGYGTRVFRFGADGKPQGSVDVGGGTYVHSNLSSAQPVGGGFAILATATGNPNQASDVALISTDAAWRPLSRTPMLQEPGAHIAMATGVRLASGYWIVNARVRTNLAAVPPMGALPDDSGALVRYIIAPDLKVVSREVLVTGSANRPHTTLLGDLLLTTWDQGGGSPAVYYRVDRVLPDGPATGSGAKGGDVPLTPVSPGVGPATNVSYRPGHPGFVRLAIATSTDGLAFTPTGRHVTDQAGVPSLLLGADGVLRLYYNDIFNSNQLTVATSRDGADWHYYRLELSGLPTPHGPPADPTVVQLPDGRYRLFFTLAPGAVPPETWSAISADGYRFQLEGRRHSQAGGLFDPMVAHAGDTWALFIMGADGPMVTLTASDGLNFTPVPTPAAFAGLRTGNCLTLPDGTARCYVFDDGARSVLSSDGSHWTLEPGTRLSGATEPAVARLADGTYLMVYQQPLR